MRKKQISELLTLLVTLLFLYSCASSPPDEQALSDLQKYTDQKAYYAGKKSYFLNEAEIRQKIVGNTIKSKSKALIYREYYNPNGSLKGDWGGSPFKGLWAVSGQV